MVGRRAAMFDRFSGWALGWLYRAVARQVLAGLPEAGTVLDVGTGPGRLLVRLASRRPDARFVGIDPSADMSSRAARHAHDAGISDRVATVVAAAEALPFPDQSFDVVVSTLSAHHWADQASAVAEQVRVLRPGGRLLVVDLRRSASVADLLSSHFADAQITQPRLPRATRSVLVCYQACRASGDAARGHR
jgi:ubiquinone/menaquinone biosynthesis C-methylase UbiE